MVRRVNIDKADEKVRKFLKGFDVKKNQYILETEGRPFMALVSPKELEETAALREYTEKEIGEFVREDALDDETLARARQLLGEAN
ncbi:MAG: hypothetical protein ACE5JO_09795 [Candidatus Binatia bacterium]